MIKELIKVATRLDAIGLTREADQIDGLIKKLATDGAKTIGDSYPFSKGYHPVSLKSDHNQQGFATFDPAAEFLGEEDGDIEALMDELSYEHESYSPHRHGGSYEMDTRSIEEGIDEDRRLDKMHKSLNEMFPEEYSFKRSSSSKRGMRKRS